MAGITAAARLARSGIDVSLYEKNDFFGGKCSVIKENGYVSVYFHKSQACAWMLTITRDLIVDPLSC